MANTIGDKTYANLPKVGDTAGRNFLVTLIDQLGIESANARSFAMGDQFQVLDSPSRKLPAAECRPLQRHRSGGAG